MKTEIVQQTIAHPAEAIFDLEPGSTVVNQVAVVPDEELVESPLYDDKDEEIDGQFQQVFEAGFSAFEAQRLSTEGMPPQFANRALEVASQFLNTALAAAQAKANLKGNKDKNRKTVSHTTNNVTNNVVMDRNEMLRMVMQQHENEQKQIADIERTVDEEKDDE